jgi:deazaflavin-dependent oxidoreductase (nitroreductase family)
MPQPSEEATWNAMIIADFREHGGKLTTPKFAKANLLLLTSIGAKSGESRTSPIGFTRDGDRYVIIGSNSGGPTNPSWLYNLRANPVATVEVGTETFQVTATETSGDERRRLFDAQIAAIPAFGDYERMTGRELPVIVLERIPG